MISLPWLASETDVSGQNNIVSRPGKENVVYTHVERIHKEMWWVLMETLVFQIAVDLSKDSNVSLKDFMNKLRDDPSMYYNSKEEVLEGFKDIVVNKINPRLTTIFKKKPQLEVE